ncbi:MAG TPA: M56 family metallopeptidase [Fimbriimonadaceae bacterium]|nr:M56 family metallopeptidase [Fimbriimonadaceae bacterium]
MSQTQLIVLFLQTGAVLLVALGASLALRQAPAVRLSLGRVALIAVLGLIVFSHWTGQGSRPIVPVQLAPINFAIPARPAVSKSVSVSRDAPSAQAPDSAPTAAASGTPAPITVSGVAVIGFLWLVGCLGLTTHLGFGLWAVARTRRDSAPVTAPEALELLKAVAEDAGIKAPGLASSGVIAGPVVAGVLRPTVFLPTGFLESTERDEVRAVLRHEVAHIANGDLKWGLLYRILCVACWPQPVIWALGRPMASAAEELCDCHVLASGVPAARYADVLLRLRQHLTAKQSLSLGIGVASRKRGISARIESILSSRRYRLHVGRPTSMFLSAGGLAVALGATVLFSSPRQDGATHENAQQFHREVRLLGPDGKPVARADAWLEVTGGTKGIEFRPLKVSNGVVDATGSGFPIHGMGVLVVHTPGLALGMARLWPNDHPADELRLSLGSHVEGMLKLADGSPATQTRVRVVRVLFGYPDPQRLVPAALAEDCPLQLAATTDDKGHYSIGDLPAGASVGCDADDDRYAQTGIDNMFTVSPEGTAGRYDITLRPAAQFIGHVTRAGKPVAGIVVGAQSINRTTDGQPNIYGWGEAVTGPDGKYLIRRLPATTYNVALKLVDPQQQEFTAVAHEAIPAIEGQTRDGLYFDLIPGALIEGHLFDSAGRPIARAEIGVYGPAHPRTGAWVQGTWTDRFGHYAFRVPAGTQYVYTMDRGPTAGETVTVLDGSRTTVDLRL